MRVVQPWDVFKVEGRQFVALPVMLGTASPKLCELCAGCVGERSGMICGRMPYCSPDGAGTPHLTFREVQIKGEQDDE